MNTVTAGAVIALCMAAGPAGSKVDPKATEHGKALFHQYCASCHGVDGKGAGPAAAALKTPPPDLTALTKDGKFDEAHVRTVIDGTQASSAHGTHEMPVWGKVFAHSGERRGAGGAQTDVWALVEYVESIQSTK